MTGLIRAFVRHPVAPNLAMLVIVIAGLWATSNLTRQLLPGFQLNRVDVDVAWPGASAEDVEGLVTQPLEDALLGLDGLRAINSTSQDGSAQIVLEYPDGADMGRVLDQVKDAVAQVRNLPESSELPRVALANRNEPVAKVLVTGPVLAQLRPLVRDFERALRARGLARVEVVGAPREEIVIEVAGERLSDLGLSVPDVAARIRSASEGTPAGSVGEADVARQLRSVEQPRSVEGYARLPVAADADGRLLTLADIAEIRREAPDAAPRLFADGKPAISINVLRAENEDAIDVAENLYGWLEAARADLPPNVELIVYDETWRTVQARIDIMVTNAVSGLILVLLVLYVFLNGRVAFWVAVGIPIAVLAAMVALYLFGGSINIMTLFALIMTLGIIVDDAIVVGEESVSLYQSGKGPAASAEQAALTMLAPVTAASLTTIAAFLPLVAIGGSTGRILFAIPLIVCCVVLASLVECFLVLPGHLRHSLEATAARKPNRFRRMMDVAVRRVRDEHYSAALDWAVANRGTVYAISWAGLILVIGLLAGGRIGFSFFPQPEGNTITANARFVAGSPRERVETFLDEAEGALRKAEAQSGEDLITLVVKSIGQESRGGQGTHLGSLDVQLIPIDARSSSNADLIRAWRATIADVPGLEYFLILNSRGGPPVSDIDVQLSGASPDVLKAAALELQDTLRAVPGTSGVRDDMSFGREQLIFELSPAGQAIGLTARDLGEQLRAQFEGERVDIFQDGGEEIEVQVRLAETERAALRTLETLPVVLPDGSSAVLSNVARLSYDRGFDALKHSDGELAVRVTADVDPNLNNANSIVAQLSRDVLPQLATDYGVTTRLRGQTESQAESFGDVGVAVPLALVLIYIILAWVFGSYLWPLAVLSIVPFGIVGAVFGHWALGFDLTILSIFGIFGLTGIVINDSIILVALFKQLRDSGVAAMEAAIEAGRRRLRAVVLTSLTTVAGIMPLLFETAREAEFLKPMVISIGFGLIFGTFMVLFLLPSVLVSIEVMLVRANRVRSGFADWLAARKPMEALTLDRIRPSTRPDPTTADSKEMAK